LSHADRVWLLPTGGPLSIGAPEDAVLSGDLERTFVSERLEFDPGEGTFRHRFRRPRHFAQLIAHKLDTELQSLFCDHDRAGGVRFLLRFKTAHAPLRLAVKPGLRDEYREQSEYHCKSDHHDCGLTHDDLPDFRGAFVCAFVDGDYRCAVVLN